MGYRHSCCIHSVFTWIDLAACIQQRSLIPPVVAPYVEGSALLAAKFWELRAQGDAGIGGGHTPAQLAPAAGVPQETMEMDFLKF